MNEQTELFLQLYKQLEFDGRRLYFPNSKENESIIGRLMNLAQLRPFKEDLDYCRVVRNFLMHNPKVGGVYPIIPSNEMIALLKHCISILNNPPKAISYAVPFGNIYTTTLDDRVLEVIDIMNNFTYTYVPVVENGNLIGIFSDNIIYTYVCQKKSINIAEDTKISEFKDFIGLDEHMNEYFEFVPKSIMLYEVEELFKYNYKERRKKLLAVVYITENGRRGEKILGMLTPWDIL